MLVILGLCGSVLIGWQLILSATGILKAGESVRTSAATPVLSDKTCGFPIAVPGTCLIAQYPVVYEGAYIEDGSGEYVVDVAAILLFNTATYGIEQAKVTLQWEQGLYEFEAHMLPPRAAVLALEKNRQRYADHAWTDCTGTQITGMPWSTPQSLVIEQSGETTMQVHNTGTEPIRDIRIYYKGYLPENGVYLGGITYCAGIDALGPGESCSISPYGFVKDYAKIIRVCGSCTDRSEIVDIFAH